jgi:hypothetical protein
MRTQDEDDREYYDRLALVVIGLSAVAVFIVIFLNTYDWRSLL